MKNFFIIRLLSIILGIYTSQIVAAIPTMPLATETTPVMPTMPLALATTPAIPTMPVTPQQPAALSASSISAVSPTPSIAPVIQPSVPATSPTPTQAPIPTPTIDEASIPAPAPEAPTTPQESTTPVAAETQSQLTEQQTAGAPSEQTTPQPAATETKPTPGVTTPTPAEEKKDIYLNFENTELSSFIDYIAEIKKINFVPDKGLEGSKISLTIREPLTVEGAWNIFLTVLEMSGFSIVKVGDVHKIIPKDKKLNQPLPAYINVPYESLPDSDLTIRYVTFLSNISVTDIKPVLESMLSQPNVVHEQKDMNAFIITDKSYNIKAAVKLIHELDQMGLPESVTVLRLKRANATDVKTLLDALIKKPDQTNPLARLLGKTAEGGTEYFSPTTKIVPEERTNSLILLGNNKSIDKIVDFISKHIDTDLKEAESPLHIYELQHIDATQVRDILKEVTIAPESTTGQAAGKFGSIRGGVKYFKNMNFQVDKDGNRLIVSCLDKQDWTLLEKTIQDLDKPQPQVAIESLLVTISSDDVKELGGMLRNKKEGQLGTHVDFQSASLTDGPTLKKNDQAQNVSLLGNLINQLVPTQGQTCLSFGKENNIWSVFKMLKTQTNASILSQPFITVANKTTANINVGSTKRIVSEEVSGTTGAKGYINAEASTKVELTPQINLDGVIRLKIRVEITEFENDEATKKSTRVLETNVSVADSQVLVLGGFIKTKVDESKNKTPVLGDIPILGWFFKDQQRTIIKEYLFIFLSPTILKPRQIPGMQLYTKMKLHQATEDIENTVETKRTQDPIHNWFFNPDKENYSHKVIDFANARYQPTTVDIKNDPYYRALISEPKPIIQQEANNLTPPQSIEKEKPSVVAHNQIQKTTPASPQVTTPPAVSLRTPQPIEPIPTPDDSLIAKRNKLKELLSRSSTSPKDTEPTPTPMPITVDPQQRESLKNLIAPPSGTLAARSKAPEIRLITDTQQRNGLNDFLTAHRALAQNTLKKQIDQKAIA